MLFCDSLLCFSFFFFKQKTAYEMRISDWSSDVCSSDLIPCATASPRMRDRSFRLAYGQMFRNRGVVPSSAYMAPTKCESSVRFGMESSQASMVARSEEHTSELQSLMRISYAVFCLKTKSPRRRRQGGRLGHIASAICSCAPTN